MVSSTIAGLVQVTFEDARGPLKRWVSTRVPDGVRVDGRADLRFVFVDDLPPPTDAMWPLPMGPAPDGMVWVGDHNGRAAILPGAIRPGGQILVDHRMTPRFFARHVYTPMIRAALWTRGAVTVHAAAAGYEGRRVAVSGWARTGKSTTVLEMLRQGASYIGDDWVVVTSEGAVAPLTLEVNVEPDQLDRRSPRIAAWTAIARAATAGTRLLRPFPVAAEGMARIASAAGTAARSKLSIRELMPQTSVASLGPLDELILLTRRPMTGATPVMAARFLTSMTQHELGHHHDLDSVCSHLDPSRSATLFPTAAEETEVLARALSNVTITPLAARTMPLWLERSDTSVAEAS